MDSISTLIDSIATIMWPLLALLILLLFRGSVNALIESARGRKFTVKIGDMEVSMDQLSKQQGDMINDLQKQVNELKRQIEGQASKPAMQDVEEKAGMAVMRTPEDAPEEAPNPDLESESFTMDELDESISDILWVDDHPENNALLINALKKNYINVSTAKGTSDALEHFRFGAFDCVISDACRQENNRLNCQAGFELASRIRELDKKVPIYIYTDDVSEKMKKQAKNVGATDITSSPLELLRLLSD